MKAKKQQEYKLKGARNISSRKPIIRGNHLFVIFIYDKQGSTYSSILCMDKNTFEIKWEYVYPFVINNMLISPNNTILACCIDGKITDLSIENGEPITTIDLEIRRCGQSSAIVDNKILVGGIQGITICSCFTLDPFQKLWDFNTDGHSYRPLISDERVYQCTQKFIRCLQVNTGALIWEHQENDSYLFNPIVYKNLIIVGGNGVVNFFQAENGKLLHQINTGVCQSIYQIVESDDVIYFGEGSGKFYAYKIEENAEGISTSLLWDYQTEGGIESTPAIKSDRILFVNNDNKLICLNKNTATLEWKFNTKAKAGTAGVLVDEDAIYTSVSKGYLYKLTEV